MCVACGRSGVPFALHVVEFYHADSATTPSSLVPMSQSRGTTRGSVPLCSVCCPPCSSCSLPIATPWIKKVVAALKAQYQGITFVVGNGFCRHVHVLQDLKSIFRPVKLPGPTASRSRGEKPSEAEHEWKNQELAVYFTPKPDDTIWKAVTKQNAELIQQGFLELWQRLGLEKYKSTDALPAEVIDTICEVANKVGEKHNLNPAFIILITHQYVDADQVMRQMYRTRWVAFMVARSDYAPPPESYMKYIKATYFSGGE